MVSQSNNNSQTSLIVGIDEAGYGPLLGPLVVSATVFEVPVSIMRRPSSAAEGPDLWQLLNSTISKKALKRDPRLAVADSKVLHGKSGITLLERAALTFLMQNDEPPNNWRSLIGRICPHVLGQLDGYPWYAHVDMELPVTCNKDDLVTQSNAISNNMKANHIRFCGAWVQILPVEKYNRIVDATRNKSVALFGECVRLIQRIADVVGPRPLRVWVDRHGGRISYRRPLMTAFEDASLDVLEESPERSGYRLNHTSSPWVIRFVRHGEEHHFPVALASIFSKYIRELFMICFNRYWAGQIPDLHPTAGYYQDGKRFLTDIENALIQLKVDRNLLVRKL